MEEEDTGLDPVEGVQATGRTVREGQGGPRHGRAASTFDEGTMVGRYVVQGVLGRGGMGVVYAALDPELDRKVALKLLQARSADGSLGGDQAWLVREAQALARLAHPNVVAIHDVGTLDGDQVFLAMEHVEGVTLREWTRTKHTWREVIAVMREAAAGLAAAHAAGLVHRDFKPDNVLVGRDGRVRVMDFGLARMRAEGDTKPSTTAPLHTTVSADPVPSPDEPPVRNSDLSIETRSPLTANLTVAGEVLGTPAYMAPEMHEGKPANARSDQFAFGVALYEALWHQRPYPKADLEWPRATVPVPKQPPPSDVPPRILRIAMRAIDPDPALRFASMEAVRAELVVDPPGLSRRSQLAIAVGAVLATAGIVAAIAIGTRSHAPGVAQCTGAEQRLAGVWDEPVKRSVQLAFTDSKRPYAQATYGGLVQALDSYAAEWTTVATESCRATRVRNDQTEAVLSLRQACLDQRLEELRALTGMLAKADGALVDKADAAAWRLEPVQRCSNVTALVAPGLPPKDAQAKLAAVDQQLAQGRANLAVGHFDAALELATQARDAALVVGFDPTTAEAQFLLGSVLKDMGKHEAARDALEDATFTAIRGKRDDVAAEAALVAARITAEGLAQVHEGKVWLGLGSAALARLGGDRMIDVERLVSEGIVAAASGDLRAAVVAHERALAASEGVHGTDDPALWRGVQTLAATLAKSGEYAKALPYFERALVLREAAVGPDHPDIALLLTSLGACYDHAGSHQRARAAFERALAIRERAFGRESPKLIATLNNMADLLREQGDFDGALAAITRAKTIAATAPGTAHPLYHTVVTTLGQVLLAAGRIDDARTELDAAISLEETAKSPMLPTTLTARAQLELALQAWAGAVSFDERAIAAFEAAGGATNPELWRPLADLARARKELGQPADARVLVDRAIVLGDAQKLAASDLAPLKALAATLPPVTP